MAAEPGWEPSQLRQFRAALQGNPALVVKIEGTPS